MSRELELVGRDAVRGFLDALYRSAPPASLVEVRFRVASGMRHCFHRAALLDRVAEAILSLASRTDVYVGVVPRRRCGGGRADLVERASVVWVDCDTGDSVDALREFRPVPAMVVASGSDPNRHAYWFLREPVALEVIEQTNRRLALALGADLRCSDAARILRPAGSVNRKHSPPAAVRLVRLAHGPLLALAELARGLPAERLTLQAPRRARPWPRGALRDPLHSVPPPVYFERLTGQRVGRSGKVRCPFHRLSVGRAVAAGVLPACSPVNACLTDRGGPR